VGGPSVVLEKPPPKFQNVEAASTRPVDSLETLEESEYALRRIETKRRERGVSLAIAAPVKSDRKTFIAHE
jgi:hypothetical protein